MFIAEGFFSFTWWQYLMFIALVVLGIAWWVIRKRGTGG